MPELDTSNISSGLSSISGVIAPKAHKTIFNDPTADTCWRFRSVPMIAQTLAPRMFCYVWLYIVRNEQDRWKRKKSSCKSSLKRETNMGCRGLTKIKFWKLMKYWSFGEFRHLWLYLRFNFKINFTLWMVVQCHYSTKPDTGDITSLQNLFWNLVCIVNIIR